MFHPDAWEEFDRKYLESLNVFESEADAWRARDIYTNQDFVEPDAQGRVLAARAPDQGTGPERQGEDHRRPHRIWRFWDPDTLTAERREETGETMPSAAASFAEEMAMAHVPVLAQELLDVLGVRPDSRVVDCTFGAGGHAALVAAELGAEGVLVACDQDPTAEHYYRDLKRQLPKGSRFRAGNFAEVLGELLEEGFRATHIYLDLGVSSMQIDTPERGFSYSYDAPARHAHGPLAAGHGG